MTRANPGKTFRDLKDGLSSFQKELHLPEDESKGESHPGNIIMTPFQSSSRKSTWYYHYPDKLGRSIKETGDHFIEITYTVNNHPHALRYTNICQELPVIECFPGYEARWVHNVGSNILVNAQLIVNDEIWQTIDQVSVDQDGQSMIEKGEDRVDREIDIGNIMKLQEWNNKLPYYETSYRFPWFYSAKKSDYFPLLLCGTTDVIEHVAIIRNKLNDFLQVREISTGEMVDATVKTIKKYGTKIIKNEVLQLPTPTMEGNYGYFHDIECEFKRCNDISNVIYVEDTLSIDKTEAPTPLGKSVSFEITHPFPIVRMGWVAQNMNGVANKDYSNYTTDSYDYRDGVNPVFSSTLMTGNGMIFKDLPSRVTSRTHPSSHYPCRPREEGYNFWCTGVQARDDCFLPGIIFDKGKLVVNLVSPDQEDYPNEYIVRFRGTFIKKIVLTDFPRTDRERKVKGLTFEIEGSS